MRRVKISKNIIKKGNVVFGLTKGQIAAFVVAATLAIGEVVIGFSILHWNVDAVLGLAFLIIVAVCGLGIFKINGMSLGKFLFLLFVLSNDERYYNSRGGLNRVSKTKEK